MWPKMGKVQAFHKGHFSALGGYFNFCKVWHAHHGPGLFCIYHYGSVEVLNTFSHGFKNCVNDEVMKW